MSGFPAHGGRRMRPRLLVTGGAGFIGTALARRVYGDYDTYLLDSLHPQVHPIGSYSTPPGTTFLPGDVTSADTVRAALDHVRPDYVVHLAAETGTGQSSTQAGRHAAVNVLGTAVLTDALVRSGRPPVRVVHASTRAVYGEGAWLDALTLQPCYPGARNPLDLARGEWRVLTAAGTPALRFLPHNAALTEPRPTSVYGVTKLAQEGVLACYASAFGSEVTTLRLQNVYGPGQSPTNSYTGVLVHFAGVAARGEPIPLYEDGDIIRDFVHVDDVVTALALALQAPSSSALPLDIGSASPVSLASVAQLIADHFDAPAPIVTGQFRAGDVRAAHADPQPARDRLGFQAQTPLSDGIAELGRWLRTQAAVSPAV